MNDLFCPNPQCHNHKNPPIKGKWYYKKGFYLTQIHGKQQKYQCKRCGKGFGLSYFNINYYCKINAKYKSIYSGLCNGQGIRGLSKTLRISPQVVTNRITRLAQKIMSECAILEKEILLKENLCADGLENFLLSQYFPCHVNILAGSESQFIYFANHHYFRRKGRVTMEQKEKMKELYRKARFERKGPSKAFRELLDFVDGLRSKHHRKSFVLDTDEHPIYKHEITKHPGLKGMIHRTSNSKEKRDRRNKLFPCNYIDRSVRKDLAEFVRETTRFARNRNNSMERFMIYRHYHNYVLPHRVNHRRLKHKTHGEMAGISKWKIRESLGNVWDGRRPFLKKVMGHLPDFQVRLWQRSLLNPMNVSSVGFQL